MPMITQFRFSSRKQQQQIRNHRIKRENIKRRRISNNDRCIKYNMRNNYSV
ncbi:unnamed protein product [Paramecium sonneborni]|uniref:Uncharacterized protein n=1 Tax=Paramecium sonneborni TaxID=65129 RepID=A0A8S1MIK2_9CILI|nr:unnamed protein product [Paramecium sonneborni]